MSDHQIYLASRKKERFIIKYLLSKVNIFNVSQSQLTRITRCLSRYNYYEEGERYLSNKVFIGHNGEIYGGFTILNVEELIKNLDIKKFKKQYGVGPTTVKYVELMQRHLQEES